MSGDRQAKAASNRVARSALNGRVGDGAIVPELHLAALRDLERGGSKVTRGGADFIGIDAEGRLVAVLGLAYGIFIGVRGKARATETVEHARHGGEVGIRDAEAGQRVDDVNVERLICSLVDRLLEAGMDGLHVGHGIGVLTASHKVSSVAAKGGTEESDQAGSEIPQSSGVGSEIRATCQRSI